MDTQSYWSPGSVVQEICYTPGQNSPDQEKHINFHKKYSFWENWLWSLSSCPKTMYGYLIYNKWQNTQKHGCFEWHIFLILHHTYFPWKFNMMCCSWSNLTKMCSSWSKFTRMYFTWSNWLLVLVRVISWLGIQVIWKKYIFMQWNFFCDLYC